VATTVSRHDSDLGRLSSDWNSALSRLSTLEGEMARLKQIQEATESKHEKNTFSKEEILTRVGSVESSVCFLGSTLRDELKSLSGTIDVHSRQISEIETTAREHKELSTQVNQHQTEIVNILQKNTQIEQRLNQQNREEEELRLLICRGNEETKKLTGERQVVERNFREELEELKTSVSKLTIPRVVGGFKASESIHQFVPGSRPLSEGIISYLTRRIGGNVSDRHCVHIFHDSLSPDHPSYLAKHVADLSSDSFFHSAGNPNQSIGYDFKDNQSISPTHYALRSRTDYDKNDHHLKSWVIEVTNDRSNVNSWIEIDRRSNNEDLNGRGIIQTFVISNPRSEEFRYIRLRQTGVNHDGNHHLTLTAFELFGQLRLRESIPL
jgi:hypothetical protein